MSAPAAFDALAASYDAAWTNTADGRAQRDLVWSALRASFRSGDSVIDLGCGTGEDAVFLASLGVHVYGIDASEAMIRQARARAINRAKFEVRRIEDLSQIRENFDGALSDFGALNCLSDLKSVSRDLALLIKPGGRVVLCTLGRFCLGESLRYCMRGDLKKAVRRWGGKTTWRGTRVFYPTVRSIEHSFRAEFALVRARSIPRPFGDHRLLEFVRR
jgi:ubiquinone/menaquinone biosynthesis C-methylase UbiE